MELISAFADTFQVTSFDVIFILSTFGGIIFLYYFISLRTLYEIGFGAMVGLGIYVLLSILLLGNPTLGTNGGLLPFGFSVIIVSAVVYLVLLLAVLFPIQGGLVLSETTNPILYTLQYIVVGFLLVLTLTATIFYMIEQAYIFGVGTFFVWFRDVHFYQEFIRPSYLFYIIMSNQNIIIPLAVMLMLYKLLFSNLVAAVVMSLVYNLSRVGFYKRKQENAYRVEFHEVGGGGGESGEPNEEAHK